MRLTTTKLWIIRASVVLAPLSAALFASCTGKGPPRPTCEGRSDAGAIDAVAITPYTAITTDARAPTEFGMEPDPGPQCTNCAEDDAFEVMLVADFENGFAPAWFKYGEPGILIDPLAAGEGLDEEGMPIEDYESPPPPYWGLQVQALSEAPGGERCGSKYALHMAGARFSSWGGGYVTRLAVVREPYIDRFCEQGHAEDIPSSRDGGTIRENGIGNAPRYMTSVESGESVQKDDASGCWFFMSPVDDQPSLLGLDVSEFDGISFWARRSPDAQATLRVALVDDSVSEDLALSVERIAYDAGIPPEQAGARCERVKECCRGCREFEHDEYLKPLSVADDGVEREADVITTVDKRCHVEGERMPSFTKQNGTIYAWDFRESVCGDVPNPADRPGDPGSCWTDNEASQVWDTWNRDHALCCPRSMEAEWADPAHVRNGDPRYGTTDEPGTTDESGVQCSPYVFLFDQSSGYYCHAPGDVLPEKNQNRCAESFESAVVVRTEWMHFRVPWSEFRRFTPDRKAINPKGIWQIAFYFSSGYLDTYVDDVGFYKRRR